MAGGVSLVSLWRGSCSTCLRLFVVVVWLVFVGGLGGIATIGAPLRRVAGVSGIYGRKTPRVVARNGQGRVPVEGSMVAKPPVVAWKGQRRVLFRWLCWSCSTSLSSCPGGVACFRWWLGGNCYHRRCVAACRRRVGGLWSQNPPCGCSKCSPPRWNAGGMGFLGCSGLRFGRGCVSVWCCGVCEGGAGGVSVGEAVADVWGGVVPVLVWCGSCSTCLRLFVVVVWLVFVGGLGGIATIGAALRRVAGVSGVYGRKTPRVVARNGQGRVPVEGSMVAKPPVCLLKVQSTSVVCG